MQPDVSSLADLHSHLVPGVDDGARTVDDVLEGVGRLRDRGVKEIVTTPHLEGSLTRSPEAFEARMETMDRAWTEASEAVSREYPEVTFRRGHEVMLDIPDVDFSDDRVRLSGTSFLLVEWSRFQVPPRSEEAVSRLRFAGFRPIFAHPERYFGLDSDLALVGEWRRLGAYLQVNYGSLVGRYGADVRRRAYRLLKRGWVDYLSTDFHGRPELDLYLDRAREALVEEGGEEHFELLAGTNPSRVLRDEEPIPVPELRLSQGFWEKLRAFLQHPSDGS